MKRFKEEFAISEAELFQAVQSYIRATENRVVTVIGLEPQYKTRYFLESDFLDDDWEISEEEFKTWDGFSDCISKTQELIGYTVVTRENNDQ